jgi:hypothetical protein
MAGVSGADADALEQLGRRMEAAGDQLGAIRDEVAAVVRQVHWEGEDGLAFRDQWQFRLAGLLLAASTATRQAGQVAVRNAVQQRITSSTDNAPVPMPIGVGARGDSGGVTPWNLEESTVAAFMTSLGTAVGIGTALGDTKRFQAFMKAHNWTDAGKFFQSPALKGMDKALGRFGLAMDGMAIATAIANHDPQAIKARSLDAVFDVATLAVGAAFPPAGLALAGAGIAWSFVPDHTKAAIVDGVAHAAEGAYHEVGKVISADVEAIKDVGEAAAGIASGGFNAVRGWFK